MIRNKIIVITGDLASGKSTVLKILKEFNNIVINTDDLARDIYGIIDVNIKTINLFGKDILDLSGKIDRKKLRDKLIENPDKVEKLNEITHPIIMKRVRNEIDKYEGEKVFVEIPLYFESKEIIEKFIEVDYVVYIRSSYDTRLDRLMKRSSLDKNSARKFMDLQMPEEYKKKNADYIIENNGNLSDLKQNIHNLLKKI
ncbi:MAG: dephospho-CoA kinase [Tissierellia bacterium]|nr:dephospho-CoA kinase [Tissierellia bacterium]